VWRADRHPNVFNKDGLASLSCLLRLLTATLRVWHRTAFNLSSAFSCGLITHTLFFLTRVYVHIAHYLQRRPHCAHTFHHTPPPPPRAAFYRWPHTHTSTAPLPHTHTPPHHAYHGYRSLLHTVVCCCDRVWQRGAADYIIAAANIALRAAAAYRPNRSFTYFWFVTVAGSPLVPPYCSASTLCAPPPACSLPLCHCLL